MLLNFSSNLYLENEFKAEAYTAKQETEQLTIVQSGQKARIKNLN